MTVSDLPPYVVAAILGWLVKELRELRDAITEQSKELAAMNVHIETHYRRSEELHQRITKVEGAA